MDEAWMYFLVATVVSFVGVGCALPGLRRWVPDVPGARSSHRVTIPRGAGVVVLAVVCMVGAIAGGGAVPVLLYVAAMTAIGFLDDLFSLPAPVRMTGQVVGSIFVVWWLVSLDGTEHNEFWWVLLGAFVAVGFINSFNFMDGINGISGVTALVCSLWYAYQLTDLGQNDLALVGILVAGASFGFLPWNFPKAKVFVGDSGSYGLGGAVAALGVATWLFGASVPVVVAPVALYVADTATTVVARRRAGFGWVEAHRWHTYQRLVDSGLSHAVVTALVGGVLVLSCAGAFMADVLVGSLLVVLLTAGYLLLPRALVGPREVVR